MMYVLIDYKDKTRRFGAKTDREAIDVAQKLLLRTSGGIWIPEDEGDLRAVVGWNESRREGSRSAALYAEGDAPDMIQMSAALRKRIRRRADRVRA